MLFFFQCFTFTFLYKKYSSLFSNDIQKGVFRIFITEYGILLFLPVVVDGLHVVVLIEEIEDTV